MRKSIMLILALAVVFGCSLAVSLGARDDDPKPRRVYGSASVKAHPTEAKAKLSAVKQLWELDETAESVGQTVFRNPDERYLWSCRLLQSERALAETWQDEEAGGDVPKERLD